MASESDKVRKQAMEAIMRVYAASVVAGIKNWVEGSEVMADAAWEFYNKYSDYKPEPNQDDKPTADKTRKKWTGMLGKDIDDYVAEIDKQQKDLRTRFAKRAKYLVEKSFNPEHPPKAKRTTTSGKKRQRSGLSSAGAVGRA